MEFLFTERDRRRGRGPWLKATVEAYTVHSSQWSGFRDKDGVGIVNKSVSDWISGELFYLTSSSMNEMKWLNDGEKSMSENEKRAKVIGFVPIMIYETIECKKLNKVSNEKKGGC